MNRGTFWLIWGIALVPMLTAMVMYFGNVAVPEGRVNSGELAPPGMVLEEWEIEDASGEHWVYSGDWHLLVTYKKTCTPACNDWRALMPNLHKALGRESNRVQWHTLGGVANEQGMLFSNQLATIEEGIWVADPLGNLVMRYDFEQPPQALLKDMKRMLRLSKIG